MGFHWIGALRPCFSETFRLSLVPLENSLILPSGKAEDCIAQQTSMAAVDIYLSANRVKKRKQNAEEPDNLMTPGDVITTDTGFMR